MGQVIQDINSSKPGVLPSNKPVDSTAPPPNNYTDEVKKVLKSMGFNMDAQGIKTWAYKGNTANKLVYWSTEAISMEEVGSYVKVIRYNSKGNTYTAGYVKIVQKTQEKTGEKYAAFTDSDGSSDFYEYKKITQTTDTKKSFDKTYAIFLKMTPAKTKTPGDP